MRLKDIYNNNNRNGAVISYEVFPPKDDTDGHKQEKLMCELTQLKQYNPALVSVTYGAGGSTRGKSEEIVCRVKNELKITPMPHFTCVSTSREVIKTYLRAMESAGVKNILALRGDLPKDGTCCHDFLHASDLIEFIKKESRLSVAAAGYPEGHMEAESLEKDIEYLKLKVDKGAEVIYTQLFFDNNKYFNFVEQCSAVGINVPIIPGILPVVSYSQLSKMTSLCKVTIPKNFMNKIEKHRDDNDYIKSCGIEFAINQCSELIENDVAGIHFYTLNKASAVEQILKNIQLLNANLYI